MRYFTNKKGTRTIVTGPYHPPKRYPTSERYRTRHRKGKRKRK